MGKYSKRELSEYPDTELIELLRKPQYLEKTRLAEILEELKKRDRTEEAEQIEKDFQKENPIYARFWIRVGAFIVDVLFLGIVGFVLGLFLKDIFVQLGSQALLVGFIIALVYFSLGNSVIFNGQTIGKKFLKVRVVDRGQEAISLPKSILRTLIYTVPYFFLNYGMNGLSEFSLFFVIKGIFFLSFLMVLPVHLILNSSTRQALQDLILKTYVVNTEAYPGQQLKRSKLSPLLYASLILLVLIGLLGLFRISNEDLIAKVESLKPVLSYIDKLNDVRNSSASFNSMAIRKLGSDENVRSSNSLALDIELNNNLLAGESPEDVPKLDIVQNTIKIVLKEIPNATRLDFISVTLIYGYDIGIYKSFNSMTISNTVGDWKEILK